MEDAFAVESDYRGDESVFNIGSGSGTSFNDLVSILRGCWGGICAWFTRLRVVTTKVPMEEGLRKTVDWLEANAVLSGSRIIIS